MNSRANTGVRRFTVLGLSLVAVTAVAAVSFFGRNLAGFTVGMQTVLTALGALLVGSCGWVSVSHLRLRLLWTPIVGIFLSLGSHWTLPLAHDAREIPPLLAINSMIFAVVAFLGGCAAVLYRRLKKRTVGGSDDAR